MNRRNGITLIEVLVTIFVMAIGLLAVLTLFPLAALNMAQAIQDDRVGHSAANAAAIANMYLDFKPVNDGTGGPHTGGFFFGPGGAYPGSTQDNGPSCPLYVDPYGYQGGASPKLGGVIQRMGTPWSPPNPNNNSPMIPPTGGTNTQFNTQTFVLQDDVLFNPDGTAMATLASGAPQPNSLLRENRYSWAYMIRRPRAVCSSVVDVQVVIYANRSLYSAGNAASSSETPVSASGATLGGTSLTITTPPSTAGIRKGTWLLDVSMETAPGNIQQFGPVHAFFYRVSGVSQQSGNQLLLEIQPPIKTPTIQTLLIMDNVVDVFDKGPGWLQPRNRSDE